MIARAMLTSKRDDYNTPEIVLDPLRTLGPIDLDPCSNPTSIVRAGSEYDLRRGQNGLRLPWFGGTFFNPPYGRALPRWIDKAATEWGQRPIVDRPVRHIVGLVPARMDTIWWRRAWTTCHAIAFWEGRLIFLGAPFASPFPAALLYWGEDGGAFLRAFKGRAYGRELR